MSTNSPTSVSTGTAIGSVTISGIQDVSGFLPLLGTKQCEEHVSNVLERGWLYAAATPMSMFGSLGILQAGFYTFLVSIDCSIWHGPRKLRNAGFSPKGVLGNLAYVDDTNDSMSGAEHNMRLILERYPKVDKITFNLGYLHWLFWNSYLASFTLLLGSLGLTPFAYVIKVDLSGRPFSQTWLYPLLRVYGCAVTTMLIQAIIQLRTLAVVYDRIQFRVFDDWLKKNEKKPPHFWKPEFRAEESLSQLKKHFDTGMYLPTQYNEVLEEANIPSYFVSYLTLSLWMHRFFLLCAIVAAGIGYVGSFGLIQASDSVNSTGPAIWLALEVVLCIIRLFIWAYNPPYDDPPPLVAIQKNENTGKIIYEVGWTLDKEAVQDVHAIIIGNNATSADNAESSAKSMHDCLLERFAVPKVQVKLFQGADSTDIKNALQNLATNPDISFGASIIIYLACHAGRRGARDGDPLFFMTADYNSQDPDTGLSYQTLLHLIRGISRRKGNEITLILDTSFDGFIGSTADPTAKSKPRPKHIVISEYYDNHPSHMLIATWSEHPSHSQEAHPEESKGPANPDGLSRPFTQAFQSVIGDIVDGDWIWLSALRQLDFSGQLRNRLRQITGVKHPKLVISTSHWKGFLHFNNIFGRVSPEAKSMVLLTIDETSQTSQEPAQTV